MSKFELQATFLFKWDYVSSLAWLNVGCDWRLFLWVVKWSSLYCWCCIVCYVHSITIFSSALKAKFDYIMQIQQHFQIFRFQNQLLEQFDTKQGCWMNTIWGWAVPAIVVNIVATRCKYLSTTRLSMKIRYFRVLVVRV